MAEIPLVVVGPSVVHSFVAADVVAVVVVVDGPVTDDGGDVVELKWPLVGHHS